MFFNLHHSSLRLRLSLQTPTPDRVKDAQKTKSQLDPITGELELAVGKMGLLREVVLLLAVSLLLGSTRAYYDYEGGYAEDYDDDGDGAPDEDYYGEEDEENYEDDGDDGDSEDDSGSLEEVGTPPTSGVRNVSIYPSCNNEECNTRVDWQPPQRDTWMSCLGLQGWIQKTFK